MAEKKKHVNASDAKAISKRLNAFAHSHWLGWTLFNEEFDIPRTTQLGWARRNKPTVPDIPYLLSLARKGNLDLNWLLLGEGTMLRGTPEEGPLGRLHAALEGELRAVSG